MMKLALCVVGCGEFAKTFAGEMDSLRDEVDLYFASRDAVRAEAYNENFQGAGFFGSYQAAAADPRVQAMYLCTPHHLHLEHALLATRAGKHVLVEKPISRTLQEGREMISQAQRAGVSLMVAENYRYMAAVRRAKEIIESGTLGDLRLVQLQEEAHFQPQRWRNDPQLNGGGTFIDGGIHKVDILLYLGGMPEQVFAAALPPGLPDGDAEDGVVVMTRSATGVVGVINHSWTKALQTGPSWVAVSGTGGRIRFELASPWLELDDGSSTQRLQLEDDRYGIATMVREFRASIMEHRDPGMPAAAALDDLAVVLKAYESIQRGVSLPLT